MADLQNQLWIRRGDDGAYEVAPYRFDGSTSFVTMDSCLDLQQELTALAIESKNRELALARLETEVIAIRDRIQFLEKAPDQAYKISPLDLSPAASFEICGRKVNLPEEIRIFGMIYNASDYPELAQYLKEKKEQ